MEAPSLLYLVKQVELAIRSRLDDLLRPHDLTTATYTALTVLQRGTRTTARDSVHLLRAVWQDHAGPAEACRQLRSVMGRQLTQQRIAAGFPADVPVAAKSGGLMGVVRNEIGVIEYPDGRGYAAAVFARAHLPWQNDAAINAAIGATAATAISMLRDETGRADRALP